jgi:hypothetical protein
MIGAGNTAMLESGITPPSNYILKQNKNKKYAARKNKLK